MDANIDIVSGKNIEFWNELCGTQLAKKLEVTDNSVESLKRFDDWYFDFYPYLFDHIPFNAVAGKDVLEVGLGYGTVSQRLAESGCKYTGLDIAQGPVEMVNHRLQQGDHLNGKSVQGSILDAKFEPNSFDYIVSIGCLHHTGDLKKSIHNCYRYLRPGGSLISMVYSAYSYRRWVKSTLITVGYAFNELLGYRGVVGESTESHRAAYDVSSDGVGAPHTDWISVRSLRSICKDFTGFTAQFENIDQEIPFSLVPRDRLLETKWPRRVGLDIYITAVK